MSEADRLIESVKVAREVYKQFLFEQECVRNNVDVSYARLLVNKSNLDAYLREVVQ